MSNTPTKADVPWLGVIADDYTGASDVAGTLVRAGMRVVQTFGIPEPSMQLHDVDCIVISLKTRSVPAAEAVEESLAAAHALKSWGVQQLYFKYCSTFDSTAEGNIGPVADALRNEFVSDGQVTVVAPGTPALGRTVYNGVLFAGMDLLQESSMRHHPLTPMSGSNVPRLLQAQTKTLVGHVGYNAIEAGAAAVQAHFQALSTASIGYAVVDTLDDRHLTVLGAALLDHPLVTGGSGLVGGLAIARGSRVQPESARVTRPAGPAAIVAGSCSEMTRAQIDTFRQSRPCFLVDPVAIAEGQDVVGEALDFARKNMEDGPVLIHSTASPEEVSRVQGQLGRARAAEMTEESLSTIAEGLIRLGCRQLIVAGGETSGAVVRSLGISTARVGREVTPGVPWLTTEADDELAILLKSGNLGDPRLFLDAWDHDR
ncbi:3-oxo-tetronate kinase [Sinomonas mesophila]|uniref:3-oxo-tetronate kinase n=1 Tax=Sinomonas mesophila TaxID=1531955 RepID=UPI000985A935|nr:3-oxo-tetronate kinase [Sinomonas mesophila]